MEFKVFTGGEKEVEQEVYFKLLNRGKYITLVACDSCGNTLPRGYILTIRPGEGIDRCIGVSEEIGLPIDADDCVKIV